jgi:hypothetical protein
MVLGTLLNAFVPKVGGVSGLTVMEVKPEQPSKAHIPIEVTELGIVKAPVKPEQ